MGVCSPASGKYAGPLHSGMRDSALPPSSDHKASCRPISSSMSEYGLLGGATDLEVFGLELSAASLTLLTPCGVTFGVGGWPLSFSVLGSASQPPLSRLGIEVGQPCMICAKTGHV